MRRSRVDHWKVQLTRRNGYRVFGVAAHCDHTGHGEYLVWCFGDRATALNAAWYLGAPRIPWSAGPLGVDWVKRERRERETAAAERKKGETER